MFSLLTQLLLGVKITDAINYGIIFLGIGLPILMLLLNKFSHLFVPPNF